MQSGVDMKQAKKGFNIISSLYTAAEVRGQVRRSRVIGHPSLSKWSLTANHLQSFWGFLSCWHTVHPTVHPLYTHCTPTVPHHLSCGHSVCSVVPEQLRHTCYTCTVCTYVLLLGSWSLLPSPPPLTVCSLFQQSFGQQFKSAG